VQQIRRNCRIVNNWTKYIKACDKKNKIIKKQKYEKYCKIMQNAKQFLKKLFKVAK